MKFYLFKNLKYLFSRDLKQKLREDEINFYNKIIDAINYDKELNIQYQKPKIKNTQDTITEIINSKKSCIRFGDGEFQLILVYSIPFQKKSEKLSKHLLEALTNKNENIITCIPVCSFYPRKEYSKLALEFWQNCGYNWRKLLREKLDLEKQYYSTEFTMATSLDKSIDSDKYFSELKQMWDNEDIVIICGKTVFNEIKNNIFDNAKCIEYIYTPSKNAYSEYDLILQKAKQIDKNKLIISICGPTATVLCYDLTNEGYRAIDFGHALKTYDWYKRKIDINNAKDADKFFAPD